MKKIVLSLILIFLVVLSACQKEIKPDSFTFTPYVTTGDKQQLLSVEPSITTTNDPNVSIFQINIDSSVTYQVMDGFGAAMSESSAYVMSQLSETTKNELNEALYGETGIGIDFIRIPMGASDFALNNYSYDDLESGTDVDLEHFNIDRDLLYVVPRLKEAYQLNPDLKLLGSPWSAPAWMKTNNSMNGGNLNSIYYKSYADYFVKFIEAYQNEGLPIYAITPQNEPLYSTGNYPTMYMSVFEMINFLKLLGPTFEENNLDTLIIGYDHNWDNTYYGSTLLDSTYVSDYVAGIGFHCYAGDYTKQSAIYDNYPDKGIWFTECSGGDWATNFSSNMSWNLENVFLGSINYGSKSVLMWNLALDDEDGPQNGGCGNCRGVVTVHEDGTYTLNEEYYMIGHFSKFVDKDSLRIKAVSSSANLVTSAFKNPDGSIAIVAHNKSNYDMILKINIDGYEFNYVLKKLSTVTLDGMPNYIA